MLKNLEFRTPQNMHYFSGGLSTDNVMFHHPSVHATAYRHGKEESFEPAAETEAKMIRNLLPDEDDLFSDVFNELQLSSDAKGGDSSEDFDLFSSVGDMELEGDCISSVGNQKSALAAGVDHFQGKSNGLVSTNNNLGPSWTGGSNHSLMRKCLEMENDGRVLYRSADHMLSSQSIYDSANQNVSSARNSFPGNSFPSSLDVSSAGGHFGLPIPSLTPNLTKFGGQYISSSVPHSFPNCENNLHYFLPYESQSNATNTASSIAFERMNMRHITIAGPDRLPMESQGRIVGPLGNATCPVHGHPWSSCYFLHHNSMGHTVLPNLPLISNIINAPPPPLKSGISAYCSGSLGNMGPLSDFLLHPLARGSPTLSHSGQSCRKASYDVMNYLPETAHSLGSSGEIWKNLSRRRNQGNCNNANRKDFELDMGRILSGEDVRTTLMLKNIPNKYSSKLLLAAIDEHCRGIYDFVYLPIDFTNNCNVGYAFINLIDPLQIIPFYKSFCGKKWEKFNSEKLAALAYARIQGKTALISHFQNSSLMNEDKRCRPIVFCTNGPNAGVQEPFPMGNNIRVKSAKARGRVDEMNRHYHGNPSTSPNSTESDQGSLPQNP